jgi:hypothetical protein
MPIAVLKEQKLGRPSKALRKRLGKIAPEDLAFIDQEIEGAPARYRRSVTSILKEDVFKRIDPQFPLLLQKTNEHRMEFGQLLGEIELLLGMGDIRDPGANVYIYSVQVMDPLDITERLDTRALEAFAPKEALVELRNGYIRHELLYDVSDLHSKILLISLLRCAKKVRIYLKPPWASYKIESNVTLV